MLLVAPQPQGGGVPSDGRYRDAKEILGDGPREWHGQRALPAGTKREYFDGYEVGRGEGNKRGGGGGCRAETQRE